MHMVAEEKMAVIVVFCVKCCSPLDPGENFSSSIIAHKLNRFIWKLYGQGGCRP